MTEITMSAGSGQAVTAPRWPGRFSPVAQALHWITAMLMLGVVVLGWYMKAMPRDLPARQGWFDLHEATGMTILLLTAVRLGWRWANPPPLLPGHLGRIEQSIAMLSQPRSMSCCSRCPSAAI